MYWCCEVNWTFICPLISMNLIGLVMFSYQKPHYNSERGRRKHVLDSNLHILFSSIKSAMDFYTVTIRQKKMTARWGYPLKRGRGQKWMRSKITVKHMQLDVRCGEKMNKKNEWIAFSTIQYNTVVTCLFVQKQVYQRRALPSLNSNPASNYDSQSTINIQHPFF